MNNPSSPIEIVPRVTISSPCVNVCRIDASGLCKGCARTLDEIARWTAESAAWRATIMAALPARHAARAAGGGA